MINHESPSHNSVIALIVRSLETANDRLLNRLEGITDEEWFWEPVPACWSVRPRSDTNTDWPSGSGEWVIDYGPPVNPAPFSTVAWRVSHTASTIAGYLDMIAGWDWDTGVPWNQYPAPQTAHAGMAFYTQQARRLRDFCNSLEDAELERGILIPWRDSTSISPKFPLVVISDLA